MGVDKRERDRELVVPDVNLQGLRDHGVVLYFHVLEPDAAEVPGYQ